MTARRTQTGDFVVMVQKTSPRPGTVCWTYWIAEEGRNDRRGPFDTLPPAVLTARQLAAFAGTRAWRRGDTPKGEVTLEPLPVS
jgi:hypothetical protein